MTSLAEIDVVAAITAPVSKGGEHSTEPLVKYLRGGGQITDYLRRLLVELLDENGSNALQLRLARRDNRRMSSKEDVDRDVAAYYRVQELAGAEVSESLCQYIVEFLSINWRKGKAVWALNRDLRNGQKVFLIELDGVTEFELRDGAAVSKENAIKIAAFEISKSSTAVKKMLIKLDRINREQ